MRKILITAFGCLVLTACGSTFRDANEITEFQFEDSNAGSEALSSDEDEEAVEDQVNWVE